MKTLSMKIVLTSFCLASGIVTGIAQAEDAIVTNDVREGRRVAILVCSNCHVVANDQPFEPTLRPPAQSFESLAQRDNISTESVRMFLNTTHRNIGNPRGMPNPQLIDSYVRQVAAYLLSLRKRP